MNTEKKYTNPPEKELEGLHPALTKYRGRSGFKVPRSKLDQLAGDFEKSFEEKPKTRGRAEIKLWLSAAASLVILVAAGLVFLMPKAESDQLSGEDIDNLALLDYLLEEEAFYLDEELYNYLGEAYLEVLESEIVDYEENILDESEEWLFEAGDIIFY